MPDQLSPDQIDVLISAATAAPSMHNTQPWRFEVDGSVIDIHLDRSRALPAEDPTGRALRIASGAAVFNLRCAAAYLGLHSWYGLMPCSDDPDHVVRVIIAPTMPPDAELAGLYHQIAFRHTSREPGLPLALSAANRMLLSGAAMAEGLELTWLQPDTIRTVLTMNARALLRGWADHDRTAERAHWIGGTRTADGIPGAALGPRPDVSPAPVRNLSAGLPGRPRTQRPYETEPTIAVLSADADSPADQVSVGMTLERILLIATRQGLRASFLNEPLEYDDSRAEVQAATGKPGFAQMIIRFSYSPIAATTPRRPVEEVVHVLPASRPGPV
ncbi:Acg family FMN-binding oxidoreductase [Kribbella sp. NPDC020789]